MSGCRLSILIATGCLLAMGQQPAIKVGVREVLAPAVVTDKSGKYVTDLNQADFTVFEDGIEQKIVGFSRPAATTPAGTVGPGTLPGNLRTSTPNLGADPSRTYLICLDNLHSRFENFARVRKALQEFFSKQGPGDAEYALMALGRSVHVVVDSTRDPAVILSAIGSKDLLKTILDSEASNLARQAEDFNRAVGLWCGGCHCNDQMIDMAEIGCPGLKSQVRAMLFQFSEHIALLDNSFLAQLLSVVHAMARMPTQRTVVFVSDGFNRFPGEEFYAILRANGVSDPAFRFNERDTQSELEQVLRVAVRYNVRFYTIDSRGLYTPSVVPGSGEDASSRGASPAVRHNMMTVAWQNSAAMLELAHETGGAFFENSNDLSKGIRRAFDDDHEGYVLAYIPTNEKADGKFRHIKIEVKRKGATVNAKTGYWATR